MTSSEEQMTSTTAMQEFHAQDRCAREFAATGWSKKATYDDIVTIIAGPTRHKFTVHESLLRAESDYFSLALNGEWKEAQNKTLELKDENIMVVDMFIHWIYMRDIPIVKAEETDVFLVESYLFGQRRGILHYQNAVMSAFKSVLVNNNQCPSLEATMLAYSETLEGSKLRQLVVDIWIWEGTVGMAKLNSGNSVSIHPGFAQDYFRGMLERIQLQSTEAPHPKCSDGSSLHYCKRCKSVICAEDDYHLTLAPYRGRDWRQKYLEEKKDVKA